MKAKINSRLIGTLKPASRPYEVWDTELDGFVLRVRPTGVLTYLFSYRRPDGRRTNLAVGRSPALSVAQARDLALQAAARVKQGGDPILERRRARVNTLKLFLRDKYGPWAESHQKRGAETIKRIETCFAPFLDRPLNEINQWAVEKWRREKLQGDVRASTVNRDLNSLKAMLNKAVEWGVIDQHPLAKLKPLKTDERKVVRYLSETEEDCLRQALDAREARLKGARVRANAWRKDRGYDAFPELMPASFADHLKPLVLLAMNTGMRRGELLKLCWGDWDRSRNLLRVSSENAKSGRARYIPLNTEAARTVEAWWQQNANPTSGVVFHRNQQPLTEFTTSWENLLKEAQIENFRWHDLRHHFASKLVMAGIDLNTVRELLGHADIKMTLRYAHLSPKKLADAVEMISRRVDSRESMRLVNQ